MRIVVVLVFVIACASKSSDKASGAKVASCNVPKLGTCREYNGNNLALGSESLAKLCTLGGSFAMSACPTDKLLGSCSKPEGKDYFYEDYVGDTSKLEADCKAGGGTFAKK
jgi:hypothetical protein